MKSIKITDHSVSQEEFVLAYNSELELFKTNPVPRNLSKYYESEAYISHTDAKKTFIDHLYQLVKSFTLKRKERLVASLVLANNKSILDIGSGTGSFLEILNRRGWNGIGVEPNAKARKLAFEKKVEAKATIQEITTTKFDVITMWHVLEHVEDLENQFLEIKRLLKPGGILIVAVPNYKSYDALYYQQFWAAYDVPRHIWHFSKTSIKKIAQKFDFNLIQEKPMWFDAFYVSMLSEKYKFKKINYLRAFTIGMLSNLKAIKSNQFSSKIYVLKQNT